MKKIISTFVAEVAFIFAGLIFVLLIAALVIKFFAPIDPSHYVYLCIAGVLAGFAAWMLIAALFSKRKSATLVPAGIAVLSCALAFQVIVPVTIERSITVFLLSEMAREPVRAYEAQELRHALLKNYVEARDVLGKRLKEEKLNGMIAEEQGRYRLSQAGIRTVKVLNLVGSFFSVPRRENITVLLPTASKKR